MRIKQSITNQEEENERRREDREEGNDGEEDTKSDGEWRIQRK